MGLLVHGAYARANCIHPSLPLSKMLPSLQPSVLNEKNCAIKNQLQILGDQRPLLGEKYNLEEGPWSCCLWKGLGFRVRTIVFRLWKGASMS